MNFKELEKEWRETCPDEADGLVSKRKIRRRDLINSKAFVKFLNQIGFYNDN